MGLDTEHILRRFQDWLAATSQELDQSPELETSPSAASPPPVGILQLVEAFTTLRHEIKLQTKSARGLEESLQGALDGLNRAAEQFRGIQPQETAAAERAARPLAESLIELDEALRRAEKAAAAASRRLEDVPQRLAADLERHFAQLTAWQRWRAAPWRAELLRLCRDRSAEIQAPVLSMLGEGYQLIAGRLRRMLAEHRIERLECVGRRVDPTRMRVIELVDAPGAAQEMVVEELRPGYAWRGQVLRYAEVRATRAAAAPLQDDEGESQDL